MECDGLRACYTFKARPFPGGPVVTCRWEYCKPEALPFLLPTVYFPYSQLQQWDNTQEDPVHVGELTPQGFIGHGDIQVGPNRQHTFFKPPYYLGTLDPGLDGQEYHGTPAQFLGEFEPFTGEWSGLVLDPLLMTDEEIEALDIPACIKAKWKYHVDDCSCDSAGIDPVPINYAVVKSCSCDSAAITTGAYGKISTVASCSCDSAAI